MSAPCLEQASQGERPAGLLQALTAPLRVGHGFGHQAPEASRVIPMGQVGQLVDHYVLYERRLQHHGAPVEAHYIVKSILRESIDVSRVVMRDRMSYCSIILDDNQLCHPSG